MNLKDEVQRRVKVKERRLGVLHDIWSIYRGIATNLERVSGFTRTFIFYVVSRHPRKGELYTRHTPQARRVYLHTCMCMPVCLHPPVCGCTYIGMLVIIRVNLCASKNSSIGHALTIPYTINHNTYTLSAYFPLMSSVSSFLPTKNM